MQALPSSGNLFDNYQTVDIYAVHSLSLPTLSPDENQQRFGIANSLHAHHWIITVNYRGPMDATCHLLSEITTLATIELLDRRHLNEVPWFQTRLPTAENIAQFVYRNLLIFRQTALSNHQIAEVAVELTEGCPRTLKDIGKPQKIVYRGEA